MITILSSLLLALTFLYFYQDTKKLQWRSDIFFSSSTLLIFATLYSSLNWGKSLFLALGIILALHTVVSQFLRPKELFRLLLVVLSGALLFILPAQDLQWNEYTLLVNDPLNGLFLLSGALLPFIVQLKSKVLISWFKIDFKNQRTLERGILIFLLGIAILISQFFSSVMGPLWIVLGFLSITMYEQKNHNSIGIGLAALIFALLPLLLKMGDVEMLQLTQGKVILGVFFGWGLALISHVLSKARMKKTKPFLLATVLGLMLVFILLFGGLQNSNFGGWDAAMGLLLGFALPLMAGLNLKWGNYGLILLFSFATLIQPLLNKLEPEVKTIAVEEVTETGEKITDPFDVKGVTPNLSGDYTFDSVHSLLTFELGPKGGRTQGAIEEFKGDLAIMEGNQLWVEVNMPMNTLTTFNKYRDESLMEEGYFNVAKFPSAQFTGEALLENAEVMKMKGNLSLLGVSKEVEVSLKQAPDENGKKVLLGKAQFDRTEFGMKSDPKEGNVVDIRFKLFLNQK